MDCLLQFKTVLEPVLSLTRTVFAVHYIKQHLSLILSIAGKMLLACCFKQSILPI